MFLSTYVNIIDLIHLPQSQNPLQTFESIEELADYTRETGKYFPTRRVRIRGLLGTLLRHIKGIHLTEEKGGGGKPRGDVPGAGQSAKSRRRQRRRRAKKAKKAQAAAEKVKTDAAGVVAQMATLAV